MEFICCRIWHDNIVQMLVSVTLPGALLVADAIRLLKKFDQNFCFAGQFVSGALKNAKTNCPAGKKYYEKKMVTMGKIEKANPYRHPA